WDNHSDHELTVLAFEMTNLAKPLACSTFNFLSKTSPSVGDVDCWPRFQRVYSPAHDVGLIRIMADGRCKHLHYGQPSQDPIIDAAEIPGSSLVLLTDHGSSDPIIFDMDSLELLGRISL